jgi:integrase-like protein
VTFADVAASYLDKHLSQFENDKHRKQWKDAIRLANKAFGDMPVKDVDTDIIVKFLTPLWKATPSTVARIRGRIEKVLAAAKAAKLRKGENPATWKDSLEHLLSAIPKPVQ